jgi:hypothetical protein
MGKNVAIAALAIAALGSLAFGLQQRAQVRELEGGQAAESAAGGPATVRQLEARLAESQRFAEEAKQQAEQKVQEMAQQLEEQRQQAKSQEVVQARAVADLKAKLEGAQATGESAEKKDSPDKEKKTAANPRQSMMSDIAKMMKNPEMRKVMEAQQKGMLDVMSKPLLDMLDLPEDQQAALKDLLLKKQMDQTEAGLAMMGGELSDEEKAQLRDQMKAAGEEVDKQIADLLGEENNAVYQAYQDSQSERMQVGMFNQGLPAEMQIDELKQNDLVFAMRKEREDFQYTSNLRDQQTMDLSQVTPEAMRNMLADTTRLHERYVEAAAEILTPEQVEKFKTAMDQQRAMQEASMRMMFGDIPESEAAPAGNGS